VQKVNRGYAGFYRGYYLRSSYEYAYAKYLDFNSIPWSYEEKVFNIGFKQYKPDFFFNDISGKIIKIVEIKSRNKEAKENAREALEAIERLYSIKCELVSYEELLVMYKVLPFSLTSTISEWVNSENTTVNKAAHGKLNGHYNLKHTEEAKKKIGEHTSKLWASDSVAKRKMLEGLRNSGLAQKGKIKTPRVSRVCEECGEHFKEVMITSTQRFCSQKCAGINAMRNASVVYVEKRKQIHDRIKEYIIQWSFNNKELLISTPLNKINTSIKPLTDDIQKLFDVKDFRVISKAVFGEDRGRKELLKFMQNVCNEKIC
jgi:endogenous inhibitor of DNA gyrase (YacG/DUF329 family)